MYYYINGKKVNYTPFDENSGWCPMWAFFILIILAIVVLIWSISKSIK
jgi:hypothetical protein